MKIRRLALIMLILVSSAAFIFVGAAFTQDDPLDRLGVILQTQGNGFERDRVFNPSVIVEGDTMYMIYRAEGTPDGSYLALAKSTDGINFTRHQGNPLLRERIRESLNLVAPIIYFISCQVRISIRQLPPI